MTNFSIFIEDSFNRQITIKENSVVKDLTGWSVIFTIKENIALSDSDPTTIQNTVTSHDDPTNGVSHISLIKEQTSSRKPTEYVYSVVLSKDADVKTILNGKIIFSSRA